MARLLQYRKIVWVFLLLFFITGIFTYTQIPKRDIPEIKQNIASITTSYPGSSPETVEETITSPMEEVLLDVSGVEQVSSASLNGFSSVTVVVENSTNSESTYASIQQSVQDIQSDLPEEARPPQVKTDVVTSSVATYHLLSDERSSLYELRHEINDWKETLSNIHGVSSIQVKGLPEQRMLVSLDQEQLAEANVQPNHVIDLIQNELRPVALGTEENDQQNYLLQLSSLSEREQLENLLIKQHNGQPLYLDDVASIEVNEQPIDDKITYEGQPALSLTIYAEEGVNVRSLQEQITEKVNALQTSLPEDVSVDQYYSQSTIIDEVYSNLFVSFAISMLAVILVMVLGLPISSAIIVGGAIPASILIGFIPLPYSGVDLNQISVIGIIVALGILVDDAIVINDNMMRRFQLGDSPLEATKRSMREVGVSIITSTLLIVFSFFPLTFLSGSNGDFIRALPIALISTVLASTLIALTVIPTIQYTRQLKWYHTKKRRIGVLSRLFRNLEQFYTETVLPLVLKKPLATVISGIIVCCLLLLLVVKVPFEFFPAADRQEVTLSLTLDEGTPIEETDQTLENIESYILKHTEHVTETTRYTGGGLPNIFSSSLERPGENTGQLVVRINRDKTSAATFIENYQSDLREAFPEGEIFLETIVSGPPPSADLELQLQGDHMATIWEEARAIKEDFEKQSSVALARLNTGSEQPVKEYTIDQDFLEEHNFNQRQITQTMQLANVGMPISEIRVDQSRMPLQVTLDEGKADGIDLSALTLVNTNGELFTYDQFVSEETRDQIAMIPHLNGKRTITLSVYAKSDQKTRFDTDANSVIDQANQRLSDDVTMIEEGEASAENEFFLEVAKLFVIVLFLIYLTLAIQFNSLLTPVLITSTVLLAVTGAIAGLFVTNQPLSFLAVLGIVSLSGIVVRNSILMIEFIEQQKAKDKPLMEAIVLAGKARLRPIILTTLTSIAALTPIIFVGDVLFRPLAISIVSGIIFSSTLTLLLLPPLYVTMTKLRKRKSMHARK